MRAILDKKVHQIQIAFDRQLKDIKPILLGKACDFIREKTEHVTKLLTK